METSLITQLFNIDELSTEKAFGVLKIRKGVEENENNYRRNSKETHDAVDTATDIKTNISTSFQIINMIIGVIASITICFLVLTFCICCRESTSTSSISQHTYMQDSSRNQNRCLLQMVSSHPATPGYDQIQINWDDYDNIEAMFTAVDEKEDKQQT